MGFPAMTIPLAMALGSATELHPVVCGLLMMIAGGAVLYYPAQRAASPVVYDREHLRGPEIFRFGLCLISVACLAVLAIARLYWARWANRS
jgi:hypothetical protein